MDQFLLLYDKNAERCFKNTAHKCVNHNLGTVKAITVTFCSIKVIRVKFNVANTKYWAKLRRACFRVWDFQPI